VTEEQRFDKNTKKMKKVGDRWNRENITVYRALVSNTLMVPVVLYKGRVNSITKKLEKRIRDIERCYMEKGMQVKWSIAIRSIKEGGIGVKDPICVARGSS